MNKVSGMDADMDTPLRASRAEQACDDRAIFVSNFSPYDDAIGGTGTVREVRAIRDA
jgi:hypothetical protein